MNQVSIIIACFNEEDTIEECLRRVIVTMPGAEILVIHGGTDGTAAKARAIAAQNKNIRVLKNYGDTGKGHAVKIAISIAQHDVMLQMDADLQFMPEEMPKVLAPILNNEAHIVFGSRFMKESNVQNYKFSFFRVMGNKIVNGYFSFILGTLISDVTTGFKAWTRKAIEDINFKDNRFVYEAEIAVKGSLKGYDIRMIPITYYNRLGGISGHGRGIREPISIIITGLKILFSGTMWKLGLKR